MPISRFLGTTNTELEESEIKLETSLRPQSFAEVIGREREKKTLTMMIAAAKSRRVALDHILFHGPPGLGKTSLAFVTAKEMGVNIQITAGPSIEKQGDLAAILSALEPNSILFIDEIHRLHRSIEEILYPAMEDRMLHVVVGKGAGAKTLKIDLPEFTIVGATTRIGLLSKPLRDRFGVDFRLDFYEDNEMAELVVQKAKIVELNLSDGVAEIIAKRARKTPRIAVKILKRVRDNAFSQNIRAVSKALVEDTLALLEIDEEGLDYLDRKILTIIANKFAGGPVGLSSIAAALAEETDTISDVYEPFLLQTGFIERTFRGRKITQAGIQHLINLGLLDENINYN